MSRGRGRSISNCSRIRPGCGENRTTRSPRQTASRTLWVTARWSCGAAARSAGGRRRAARGSSRRARRTARPSAARAGPGASARASATRCFMPPESSCTCAPAKFSSPTSRRWASAISRRSAPAQARHQPEPEQHVAHRGQPREQGGFLEHHQPMPPGSLDRQAIGEHVAAVRPRQAGDDVEQRGLAAAAGADDADELARADVERNVVERLHRRPPACGTT